MYYLNDNLSFTISIDKELVSSYPLFIFMIQLSIKTTIVL